MKNKKTKLVLVACGCVLAAVLAAVFLGRSDSTARGPKTVRSKVAGILKRDDRKTPHVVKKPNPPSPPKKIKQGKPMPSISFKDFAPADRVVAERIQTAADGDDFNGVLREYDKAVASKDPRLREHLVEALSWFGKDALPELTTLMSDRDEDVAESAMDAWQLALTEVEEAPQRQQIAETVLDVIADEDVLRMVGSEFTSAALEIIDGEEDEKVASEKRVACVQSLVDCITGEKPVNAKVAREMYEDLTGHPWISIEEAEKYLHDPDNYEEPGE